MGVLAKCSRQRDQHMQWPEVREKVGTSKYQAKQWEVGSGLTGEARERQEAIMRQLEN